MKSKEKQDSDSNIDIEYISTESEVTAVERNEPVKDKGEWFMVLKIYKEFVL